MAVKPMLLKFLIIYLVIGNSPILGNQFDRMKFIKECAAHFSTLGKPLKYGEANQGVWQFPQYYANVRRPGVQSYDVSRFELNSVGDHRIGSQGGAVILETKGGVKVVLNQRSIRDKAHLSAKLQNANQWKQYGMNTPEFLGLVQGKEGEIFMVMSFARGKTLLEEPIKADNLSTSEAKLLLEQLEVYMAHHPNPSAANIIYDSKNKSFTVVDSFEMADNTLKPDADLLVSVERLRKKMKSGPTKEAP